MTPSKHPLPRSSADPVHRLGSWLATFSKYFTLGVGVWLALPQIVAATVILHMKNGDRFTGEILTEAGQRIVLKSPLAGRIALSAAEVVRREAVTNATPALGAKASSKAATASKTSTATPASSVAVTNAMATSGWLTAWARPLLTNWHGSVQLGMDLGFGTTDRQTFYANANLNHSFDRFRNNFNFRSAYGIAEAPVSTAAPNGSVQTANSLEGLYKTDFDLGHRRKIYLYHQIGAGFDQIRRHKLRFEDGAGLGYKLIERPRWTVNTEAGGQFQHFTFRNGPRYLPFRADQDILSVRLGENISWKASDKLTLTHRLQVTPNVEDFADFRARFELGFTYPLLKRVTINLNVFDEYESRPTGLVENNQLQIQATVGLTF